jgi:uncharacterized protein (TIGR02231 family)
VTQPWTDAPITAVTVYPDRARVTRRAALRLAPGEHRIPVGPLPVGLHRDSLRVAGQGPATVLGVDVVTRHLARTGAPALAELETRRRDLTAEQTGLTDAEAVEEQREEFLTGVARRAGGSYARALATREATPDDLAGFAESVAGQLTAIRARQRGLARRREEVADELAALERQISVLSGRRLPDETGAEISLAVATDGDAEAEVELELSYVVDNAGWRSSYDLRLVDDELTLTWFGLVTQQTGENWPECALTLSTARPAAAVGIPELSPWYLDRSRPVPALPALSATPGAFGGVGGGGPDMPRPMAPARAAESAKRRKAPGAPPPPVTESVAVVEQGVAAATYRVARPVAVPADGGSHRATVAVVRLSVKLDHVTAPVQGPEAHLRATVTNSSEHTLPAGPASVFHGPDFVGSTPLPVWAPGEEVELALGVDDRVRVERELVRRGDTKATLGSTRRREVEHKVTVTNHTPRPVRVTVLDQLPVSRDEGISVREIRLDPAPDERTELGELTWRLELPTGGSREIRTGVRVDIAKGVDLLGWRD